MKNYNLADIHFHTNDSFDAYENAGHEPFNLDIIIQTMKNNSIGKVQLVCKTDHNILNYEKYCNDKLLFESSNIIYFPGIEINGNDKVHWLFIFSNDELSKEVKGIKKGKILENNLYSKVFKYKTGVDRIKQAESVQQNPVNIESLLSVFHDLRLSYLAVPHLNKSGGFYNKIKSNEPLFNDLIDYLNDGVICGFESKQQKKFIKDNIEQTQNKIKEIIELIESQDADKNTIDTNEEIERRKQHLNKMHLLSEKVSRNGVSIIYGSDFHGIYKNSDYINCINDLFYIHSEATYEGLKLSLLDQESRIFSISEFNQFKKTSNYVISHIDVKINNKIVPIHFGDNMNSIIGSRGSGKSYILKCLTGDTLNYQLSNISKNIRVSKIHMVDGSAYNTLPQHTYDLLSQQSSDNKGRKNFYNLLSEAPYDMEKFEYEIDKLDFEKSTSDDIQIYFMILNKCIDIFKALLIDIERKVDFSFVPEYNSYFESINVTQKSYQLFSQFDSQIENLLETYGKQKKKIDETKNLIVMYLENMSQINQYKLVKQSNISFEEDSSSLKKAVDKLDELIRFYEAHISSLKKVHKHSSSIVKMLRLLTDNQTSALTNKIQEIEKLVISFFEKCRLIKSEIIKLKQFNEVVKKEVIYKYTSGESEYVVKVIKEIDTSNISETIFIDIFNRYRDFEYNQSILKDLQSYEELEKQSSNLKKIDQRFKTHELTIPKIASRIELVTEGKTVDWAMLSPGERSSYLLNIVLDSNSNKILLIDQPEDDLDNETVYKSIVAKLRLLKKKRQIIVVSHNANIVINGDSDSIIVNYNHNGNFSLINGYMENTDKINYPPHDKDYRLMDLSAEILEGGREALRMRIKKIGNNNIFFKED